MHTSPPGDRPEPFRGGLLRLQGFRMLLGSVVVSEVGTQVSLVAMPLVAVLTLSASPFEVGLLTTAERAAFLLIGLPAGVWVDRMRRRSVMVTTDVLRGVMLLSIPIAAWLGVLSIWQLYGVALALGVATVFFDVSAQSYLPFLIGREHLLEGNARLETVRVTGQIAGPSAGGWLVQLVTAPIAILADATSYLGSAVFLAGIRTPEPRPSPGGRRGLWREMREGLAFVVHHPILRGIAGCTAIANLFSAMGTAVEIVFLVRVVGLTAGQIGMLMTAAPVGGLVGGLLVPRLSKRIGTARTIWAGFAAWTFGVLMPLAAPGWRAGLFAVGLFMFALGAMLYNVSQISFRQAATPEAMLGRVNATIRCLVWGTLPLGGLIGGALGQTLGLRTALWISVLGGLLSCVPLLLSPLRTMRDM
ncbi:MAG TPA: MFS transporter [Streptosporangiaceae bacterium]|jgi:MFS family permease